MEESGIRSMKILGIESLEEPDIEFITSKTLIPGTNMNRLETFDSGPASILASCERLIWSDPCIRTNH